MSWVTNLDRWERRRERKLQLLRGRIARVRGARTGQRFGVGRGVQIVSPSYLEVGDDVTVEDYGYLNCLSAHGVRIGSHTSIARNLWLHCGGETTISGFFEIGEHSFIGCNAAIGAGGGGIRVGNNVLIGQCVNIHSENHIFSDPDQLIRNQGISYHGVTIEDDVWIGAKATILDGVTIGKGSVIAAGAVVTQSIPAKSIAMGIPARVVDVRQRK